MSIPIQFIRAANSEEGPQLWLTGEVGVDFTFAQLQSSLSNYANDPSGIPTLNLYSHGGYLNDATAFYDWADKSQVKFRVRVWGTAMSAMTIIAAAAGRENIEIAPNATWMIHECSGGTEEMQAHGNDAAVRIYRKLTNLTDKKLREMMAATTTLNAQQAVEMGFAGKIIKTSVKLAAMHDAKPIDINDKPTAMADKKTIKVQAQVKLATMDAARAAFSAEGVTAEVEVDIEQATADALAAKDTVIAEKDAQIATLKAEKDKAVEVAQAEAITNAQQEAVTAKADLATAIENNAKALADLKASHEAAIAELKKPLATGTVANNQAAAVAAMPNSEPEDPNLKAIKNALKSTSPSAKVIAKKEQA